MDGVILIQEMEKVQGVRSAHAPSLALHVEVMVAAQALIQEDHFGPYRFHFQPVDGVDNTAVQASETDGVGSDVTAHVGSGEDPDAILDVGQDDSGLDVDQGEVPDAVVDDEEDLDEGVLDGEALDGKALDGEALDEEACEVLVDEAPAGESAVDGVVPVAAADAVIADDAVPAAVGGLEEAAHVNPVYAAISNGDVDLVVASVVDPAYEAIARGEGLADAPIVDEVVLVDGLIVNEDEVPVDEATVKAVGAAFVDGMTVDVEEHDAIHAYIPLLVAAAEVASLEAAKNHILVMDCAMDVEAAACPCVVVASVEDALDSLEALVDGEVVAWVVDHRNSVEMVAL